MQAASLILKAATREDTDRLLAFYKSTSDRFLLPRPTSEFDDSIERGQFFIVINDKDEIVAGTGVFDYDDQPFVELAETLVAKSARGFGLQNIFFKLRIASTIVYQGRAVGITTAIDSRNKVSLQTTSALGFEAWAKPVREAYSSCTTCPSRSAQRTCCCDFYLLPADKARDAVRELLAETRTGGIKLKNKKGDAVEIRFECAILAGDLRKALRRFAAGENW